MKGKKWLVLVSLGVALLVGSAGIAGSFFVDQETSTGNSLQAWTSNIWTQTTQADFEAGVLSSVNTTSSPGDVKLAAGYVTSGTIASQVKNTGVPGARWDALFWVETLQDYTDITFKVRASDNLFTKDAAPNPPSVPDWISVGGTSPVTSGLPPGQYKQWQATLTTTNTTYTPTLHEVRVYHY